MKKTKQKLSATWEILTTAEYVEELGQDINDDDLKLIYQGSFVPLFYCFSVQFVHFFACQIAILLLLCYGFRPDCVP